jgi:hypothetical protein
MSQHFFIERADGPLGSSSTVQAGNSQQRIAKTLLQLCYHVMSEQLLGLVIVAIVSFLGFIAPERGGYVLVPQRRRVLVHAAPRIWASQPRFGSSPPGRRRFL